MKKIFKIIVAVFFGVCLNSCGSQTHITPEKVNALLQSKEFTFMAVKANPTSYDVVKVMNSLPTSSASQILNLDYGYTLEIKKDKITAQLPYFGRMYSPSYNTENNSYRFTTKDFTMNENEGRKGSVIFTILPKDEQNIRRIVLEVFKNGKAYLSIDSNDRQLITYDGYLMENQMEKK